MRAARDLITLMPAEAALLLYIKYGVEARPLARGADDMRSIENYRRFRPVSLINISMREAAGMASLRRGSCQYNSHHGRTASPKVKWPKASLISRAAGLWRADSAHEAHRDD